MNEIKGHWFNIIKDYFPEGAELTLKPTGDDFSLDVCWYLMNDQNRPKKRSRILRLIISYDEISDYRNAGDDLKDKFDQKLIAFVKDTLNSFEPDHDTPLGQMKPVEEVVVPFSIT